MDDVLGRRLKVKTRPALPSIESLSPSEDAATIDTPHSPKQQFVDKRALKVFDTLFFVPKAHAQSGELEWKDLLHAMTSIGFSAAKIYGSVWMFEPNAELKDKGPIQFHEPHPGKLRYSRARAFGRRLAKRYGWSGATFALK